MIANLFVSSPYSVIAIFSTTLGIRLYHCWYETRIHCPYNARHWVLKSIDMGVTSLGQFLYIGSMFLKFVIAWGNLLTIGSIYSIFHVCFLNKTQTNFYTRGCLASTPLNLF